VRALSSPNEFKMDHIWNRTDLMWLEHFPEGALIILSSSLSLSVSFLVPARLASVIGKALRRSDRGIPFFCDSLFPLEGFLFFRPRVDID
jgi:hypothetical protein